jgi:protein arginine kinase activator
VKCQLCSNPATVHQTVIIKDHKKVVHLCQKCAESNGLIKQQELNLPAIFQKVLGLHLGPHTDELARLTCPACGIKYMEFRAQGRLGCPHDYAVFRTGLEPLLQRIHRARQHVGKSPRRIVPPGRPAELVELRRLLQAAIETENYEEAARLRDLLRQKEATDECG